MNCHVNVELCMNIHSIKYVLKYVTKGCDQAVFALEKWENVDEIQRFQQARYVGSSEAAWRILDCPLHERLCNWQYTWKMAKECTLQKQQSTKGLNQNHRGLHVQSTYHLTSPIALHALCFTWICHVFTHGTMHERFGVAANVETKWHMRRTSLKPLQLDGFTL